MSNWLSVKDNPPDNTHGNKIWACSDEDGVWCSVTSDTPKEWMPLPAPPK